MEPETEAALAKAQAEQFEAQKRVELECERAVMLLTCKRDKELLRSHHESEAAIEQAKVEHKGDSAKLKAAMTKIWQDAAEAMQIAKVDCDRRRSFIGAFIDQDFPEPMPSRQVVLAHG